MVPDRFDPAAQGLSNLAPQETYILLPGSASILRLRALADRDAAARATQQQAERAARSPAAGVVSLEPLVVEGKSSIALLPMSEVFREINPEDGPPTILWAMESALFVRWGYSQIRGDTDHRADFTRFVYRASPGNPSPSRCSGNASALATPRFNRASRDSCETAVENLATLKYKQIQRWPPRTAACDQARGHRSGDRPDHRRLGALWCLGLKDRRPDLGRMYLEQAGEALLRPYQDGERDPRLLAVIGLYKHDIGEDAASRELLEEAVEAGWAGRRPIATSPGSLCRRPRACRGRRRKAKPAAGGRHSGPNLLSQGDGSPSRIDLSVRRGSLGAKCRQTRAPGHGDPRRGVRLFTRAVPLAYAAASLCSRWGYAREMAAFKAAGLRFADAAMTARFEELKAVP